jgi:hypothetical protein
LTKSAPRHVVGVDGRSEPSQRVRQALDLMAGEEARPLLRVRSPRSAMRGTATLHIGSHSTDFDAYYMSGQRGSDVKKPGMFSTQLIDGFEDRLINERPEGWLVAADIALTLSLAQLAFVDHAAPLLARAAAAEDRVVSHSEFEATVVGLPSSGALPQSEGNEASGPHAYVEVEYGSPRVVWASLGG